MKTRTGYLIKRNRIYHACWTVNNRKFMKSTGKVNRKEAKAKLDEMMSAFRLVDEIKTLEHIAGEIQGRRGEIARINDARNPPLAVADAWKAFLSSTNRPDSGPATLQQYGFQFARFKKWLAGAHPTVADMRDVTEEMAREYASHLQQAGVAAGTFTKHIRLLNLVFTTLSVPSRLTVNPWNRGNVTRKKALPQSRRDLTVDELRKVCESAAGELRTLLALGVYTGLRLGDCCTLRWCEVDFTLGFIRRLPNKTMRKGTTVRVPIHGSLRAILEAIPAANRGDFVLPELAAIYTTGKRYHVTDRIQDHFLSCGIKTQKPGTGKGTGFRAVVEVGFHSLRHSFVSICRAAAVPLSVVESLVGHSNPAMTRLYSHTSETAASDAVNGLPVVIGEAPKALLPPATRMVDASIVRRLAEGMTSKTWRQLRAELLTLTANPE